MTLPTPVGVCPARWGRSAHRTQTPNGGVFSSWTPPAGWPDSHVSAAAGTTGAHRQWVTKVWAYQSKSCPEIKSLQPVFFWLPLLYFAYCILFCGQQNSLGCTRCNSMWCNTWQHTACGGFCCRIRGVATGTAVVCGWCPKEKGFIRCIEYEPLAYELYSVWLKETKHFRNTNSILHSYRYRFTVEQCKNIGDHKSKLDRYTTHEVMPVFAHLQHSYFSQGNLLNDRVILRFDKLLDGDDLASVSVSALEHHAVGALTDFG